MSTILEFIKVFSSPSNKDLFTNCACYWFANILYQRFSESSIVYDPHQVHFATKIKNQVYDINGLVEEDAGYLDWEEYSSYADDIDLIKENCIRLERR